MNFHLHKTKLNNTLALKVELQRTNNTTETNYNTIKIYNQPTYPTIYKAYK
jgi:hypothetical protein